MVRRVFESEVDGAFYHYTSVPPWYCSVEEGIASCEGNEVRVNLVESVPSRLCR